MKVLLIKNSRKKYTNQLLENLIKEKYTYFLLTMSGVQIQRICNEIESKLDKGFRSLLFLTDIYSRYASVFPLKDKKGITITNSVEKVLK